MRNGLLACVTAVIVSIMWVSSAVAGPSEAPIEMWRLDCGTIALNDASPLSDTGAYHGQSRRLSNGCYLIRHGNDYLLWDAGLPTSLLNSPIKSDPISPSLAVDLTSQLRQISVEPEQIGRLVVSHYHFDHIGQADSFTKADLLIGAGDWAALQDEPIPFGADPSLLSSWLSGKREVDIIEGDRDIFGDGSVIILASPGHTPGSMALLVNLPESGPIILSGDVVHLDTQWEPKMVPVWNTDRADSLAAMDRLQRLAETIGAKIVVQHDPADIPLLAKFPESSR